MAYVSLTFNAAAGEVEAWADALLDAGAMSVDVADPDADSPRETPIYGEPGEPVAGAWATNRLCALFGPAVDPELALAAAARAVGRPVPAHDTAAVEERDWVRATQAQFAPIPIDERLWIVPTWCAPVDSDAINLTLDPGLAFGTGSHPTTRLCLRWLVRELRPGDSVLDYGCGSGILAIAAARLGAGPVVGTDVDPPAIAASRANAHANEIEATFVLPDGLRDAGPETFDIVVANILANPLVLLAPALARRVRPGGRIVLSGILAAQAEEVAAAYTRWFNIRVWQQEDEWVALAGILRSSAG